jgi:tetratricopeptide (TPR) repeat protein
MVAREQIRESGMSGAQNPGGGVARMLRWILVVPVLLAVAFLHAPALDLPFFADDYLFLDQVRDRSLPETLASGDPLGNFFRPIGRQVHFWWLAHATDESALAFHTANVAAYLLMIGLLFAIALRVSGLRAAVFAAAFLGLHYSADVAIRWASGSQDLLAVVGALAALLLYLRGLRWAAAASLLLGLLSKETVALTPIIAIVLARRDGEAWKNAAVRAWPLFVAVGVWAVAWVSTANRVAGAEKSVELNPWGLPAALAHLMQVTLGLEWTAGSAPQLPPFAPLVPLSLMGVTLWIAWARRDAADVEGEAASAVRAGVVWAVLGALPVAAVASIWSAYYYMFALCGVGLLLGSLLARRHVGVGLAVLVLLAWGSQSGRHLDEFSTKPSAWNTQSHVNRFYMERSMAFVSRYLDDMKRLHPDLPERTTVFFSGIPSSIAWQSADGPVLRWAYRDSSLRSYWLTAFSRAKVLRGPAYAVSAGGDSLRSYQLGPSEWAPLALSLLLDGKDAAARDALTLAVEANPSADIHRYRLGMTLVSSGDTSGFAHLRASGAALREGPAPNIERALRWVAAGDTTRAWQEAVVGVAAYVLDAGVHALLADLALTSGRSDEAAYFESFVAMQLAPEEAVHWRRWGLVLARTNRHQGAVAALDRYLELAGNAASDDAVVTQWLERIRPRLPGGAQAGEELRRLPGTF